MVVVQDGRLVEEPLVKVNAMHQALLIARDKNTPKVVRDYLAGELKIAVDSLKSTAEWFEKEMRRLGAFY